MKDTVEGEREPVTFQATRGKGMRSKLDSCPPYCAAALIGKEALCALHEVAVARFRKVAKRHAKPDAVQPKDCDLGVELRRPLSM